MLRTVCSAMVLLIVGVAQSAPPEVITPSSHPRRIRFLSLAEARAIALENENLHDLQIHYVGLNSQIPTPQPAPPKSSDSIQVLANLTPGTEGIFISGIPRQTPRPELERKINQMLLNIENAYWNLYGSYWQLHTREQGLRFAHETWKIVEAKSKAGTANRGSMAQAEGQYNLFRSQRLQAFDTVLDNERQLRAMLGMSIEDGTRLVPSDTPTIVEKRADWDKGLTEVLKYRPELNIARQDVKRAELALTAAKNASSIVEHVQGSADGKPTKKEMQLQVARVRLVLQDQELKAERFLGLYYRRMSSAYFQIKAARAQCEAFAKQVRLQSDSYRTGEKDASLNLVLEGQRFWADALATEYQALVTYNNAIAGWEYAKGTILQHARVTLTDKPPCGCAKVRAVVYERKQTRTQVRREPAVQVHCPLDAIEAASLPALWKSFPPLRDADELPSIENVSYRKGERADKLLTEWKVSDIFPPKRGKDKQTP